ncbi:hypothetical protein N7470_002391 [Penicillium chermesinum]|nr:hypothetical protein N7470_002391 [Penicillium chermesinum]
MGEQPHGHVPNVPLDRAGMILFAMLSGGDYAEGLKGCGSKLAAEIALAGFGEDLLNTLSSHASDLDSGLSEWRERLQYELDENESGYFKRKHKAVRIPEDFPNRTILKYYAEPIVSTEEEVATLKSQLRHSWDREIDAMAIRAFTADNFEWNYRSGARKVIKLLAEPLVSYRLRLQRPVKGVPHGTLAPECDTPWLQKVHRSRANFGTDGTPELQVDMLPIDVVGIDLFAEEPNPPMPSQDKSTQSTAQSGAEEGGVDEEDLEDAPADETARAPPPSPSKSRVTRRYDPLAIEKVWVFETVAKLGIPDIVEKWDKEQAEKAENAKKTTTRNPPKRRTGPKKKGPIDPGMQRGSILKYGTLTKERSELSSSNKTRLIDAATSKSQGEGTSNLRNPPPAINLDVFQLSPSMYPEKRDYFHTSHATSGVDELIDSFSSLSTTTHTPSIKRHPMSLRSRPQINLRTLVHGERELDDYSAFSEDVVSSQGAPSGIRLSYVVSDGNFPQSGGVALPRELGMPPVMPEKKATRSKKATKKLNATEGSPGVDELEEAIESLTLSLGYDESCSRHQPSASRADGFDNDHPDQIHKPTSIPESEHCSDARKSRNRQTPQEEDSSSVRKKKDPKPIKTVGHAENISTFDGFWEVHNDAEEVSDTTRSTRATTGKDEGNKKRFSRVSILDMI